MYSSRILDESDEKWNDEKFLNTRKNTEHLRKALKIFDLGTMRDFCYEVTYRNTSKGFDVSGHTSKDELAKKIGVGYGECLYKLRTTIGVDLSDEKTLDELSTRIVKAWINSWTHKVVLQWYSDTASTVTSLLHITDDGRTNINVTLHTRDK